MSLRYSLCFNISHFDRFDVDIYGNTGKYTEKSSTLRSTLWLRRSLQFAHRTTNGRGLDSLVAPAGGLQTFLFPATLQGALKSMYSKWLTRPRNIFFENDMEFYRFRSLYDFTFI